MLIGLTGGIGSGKTTIAKMFSKFENVVIYFADDEAKKLMNTSEKIVSKLKEEFSDQVYINGGLNRPFLASIVFKDKEKLKKLNEIVHPVVHEHLQSFINTHKEKEYILYENAILFENGSHKLCNKIITVSAPEKLRIERVMKRDEVTEEDVTNRIRNQWSEEKKTIQSHYVVHNVDVIEVKQFVKEIHNKLTKS